MSPIVTVFGATGTQGSSVVRALLEDGGFEIRAITRNIESKAAQHLTRKGVHMVQADLWDGDSVVKALQGTQIVFGVTNFWDSSVHGGDTSGEVKQGRILVDAAKQAGVKFFVWSSLPNAKKHSEGKYTKIAHFDGKDEIYKYLIESGVPHAVVQTGWFGENLWKFGGLAQKKDGTFEIPIPLYSAESPQSITYVARDLGPSVVALMKNYEDHPDEILNQIFYPITARVTYPRLAEILAEAFGKEVTFRSAEASGNDELDEMYAYQSEYGLYLHSQVPDPRLVALGVKFSTLEELAEEAKGHFDI